MPKRPEIRLSDFCEPLEIDPIAIIPFDASLFGNARQQRPDDLRDGCEVADGRDLLADRRTSSPGRVAVKKAKKGGLGSMLGLPRAQDDARQSEVGLE